MSGLQTSVAAVSQPTTSLRSPRQHSKLITAIQEWASWMSPPPPAREVSLPPAMGTKAPTNPQLQRPKDNKPTLLVFLRHCGCPWAEKSFKELVEISQAHKSTVHCVAVSHSSPEATERWVVSVGGNWDVEVVVDEERELYASFGLGTSTAWHVLSPWSLLSTIQLGRTQGIKNRPTESGSRWQTSGSFGIDKEGVVRWSHVAQSADDTGDLMAALTALGLDEKSKDAAADAISRASPNL
jgi:hypothetical protein